jgi:hypothetical protein
MDIPDLIVGVIFTIIGIVFTEWCIHYFNGRKNRRQIITSLIKEIFENFKKLEYIVVKSDPRAEFDKVPLKTSAYQRYCLFIDEKIFNELGGENNRLFSRLYDEIEIINRWIEFDNFQPQYTPAEYMEWALEDLKEIIPNIKSNKKTEKFFKKISTMNGD